MRATFGLTQRRSITPLSSCSSSMMSRCHHLSADADASLVPIPGADRSTVMRAGAVTFSRHPSGIMFGKVETADATYLIKHKAGPIHVIVELDRTTVEDEGPADGVVLAGSSLDGATSKLEAASVCLAGSTCSNQTVRRYGGLHCPGTIRFGWFRRVRADCNRNGDRGDEHGECQCRGNSLLQPRPGRFRELHGIR